MTDSGDEDRDLSYGYLDPVLCSDQLDHQILRCEVGQGSAIGSAGRLDGGW